MTHGHSQYSQTNNSCWAVTKKHWLQLECHTREEGGTGGESQGHFLLRITLNIAYVSTTHWTSSGILNTQSFTHLFSSQICHSTHCLCPLAAPSHPPPSVKQCCALDESASVFVESRVVLDVALDRPSAKTIGLTDPLGTHTPKCAISRVSRRHKAGNLTVQLEVLSFPGLLWPALQHDDRHPLMLL